MRSTALSDLEREYPPLFSLVLSYWKLRFQMVPRHQSKKHSSFFRSACKYSLKECTFERKETMFFVISQAFLINAIIFLMFLSTYLMDDVSRLEDPFNLVAGLVGLTIVKGLEISGRGIKVSSSSLIICFNLMFYA
jgi:hypothetical protein